MRALFVTIPLASLLFTGGCSLFEEGEEPAAPIVEQELQEAEGVLFYENPKEKKALIVDGSFDEDDLNLPLKEIKKKYDLWYVTIKEPVMLKDLPSGSHVKIRYQEMLGSDPKSTAAEEIEVVPGS
ncbi:DUF3221 domain-containing protein [Rossellomorea marisflavi]|uniref:DUF3221 domain-containing protein n=1 Tax=Rossellomorea marisflavi TaxID=189381 RepID=UPI0009A7401D|nr:DUF3221 domain-containing protein [Rossellomorea marisflavi]MDW4528009.1 DUF3221 domain-containing protein [Rossellomorea marisflavi]UKS64623.1 DUF3221 domain-containing protein [Rossellomorea marisflavi]WJV19746.1 DUF3221 domain-containing protein [Rossellomorea marisflavi]